MHNYLRITRILKFLADMDMDKEQIAWLKFLRCEIFLEDELVHLATSFCRFWIHTVNDGVTRENMIAETKSIIEKS